MLNAANAHLLANVITIPAKIMTSAETLSVLTALRLFLNIPQAPIVSARGYRTPSALAESQIGLHTLRALQIKIVNSTVL